MKYFKQYWALILLGFLYFGTGILLLVHQHNENKLEYHPGEEYNFTFSNVTLDLWGDNVTVIYHYDNIEFIKQDKYYFQKRYREE